MTSHREDKIIIAENGIITEEALLAYLNDKLAPEERHELERLMKDDPFAQDALEGLKSSQNKAAVANSLASIHSKIRARVDQNERRIIGLHWTNFAWAAVILGLLISLGFITASYLGKHSDNTLATTETTAPVEQKIEAPKTVTPTAPVIDTTAVNPVVKDEEKPAVNSPAPVERKDNNQVAENPKTTPGNGSTGGNFTPTATGNNKASDINRGPTPDVKSSAREKAPEKITMDKPVGSLTVVPATKNDKKENEEKKTETTTDNSGDALLKDAKNNFDKGNYRTSADQYDEILKREPENPDALFFGGVSEYVKGDLKKSEKNFDQLLKQGKKFQDGSKWYKASILMKKGNKDQAKKILQELSQGNGSYKGRAASKLAEMEK